MTIDDLPGPSSEGHSLRFPHDIQECPFPFYAARRVEAPVAKVPGGEDYFVARWDDLAFVAQHPEVFSNRFSNDGRPLPALPEDYDFDYSPYSMVFSDPPEHKHKRAVGLRLVGRERLREYEPIIRLVANNLIDDFASRGEAEFVSEFASWLPIHVIAEVLGLPRDDAPQLKVWGDQSGQGARYRTEDELKEERERTAGLTEYLREAVLDRYRAPRSDGLSELVHGQVHRDGKLNMPYLVSEAALLLFAGNVTTTHMLSNTMLLLLRHRDILRRVQADNTPTLIRPVLEEALRLESPVQFTMRRTAHDTELAGTELPAESMLVCGWQSGNRDQTQWDDPDEFRPGRPGIAKRQLAFGRGPHMCLGAPLARLEGTVAFEELFRRLPNLRPAQDPHQSTYIGHPHFRAPESVRIRFDKK